MSRVYDLGNRTAVFGELIIEFVKTITKNEITKPLISQIVRLGTSIGANYMEADAASSKKDFRFKLSICRKEAKETCHWLRMLIKAVPTIEKEAEELHKEAHELVLIFSTIINRVSADVRG